MIGLAHPIVQRKGRSGGVASQPTGAWSDPSERFPTIGLVVSRNYPDLESVRQRIEDLDEPGAIWVCAETDLEARRLLEAAGVTEPVLLPLLRHWKCQDLDVRRQWRDCELLLLCERVYVFQPSGSKTQWTDWAERAERYGVYPGLRLKEAGKAPEKRRARRKPVGA